MRFDVYQRLEKALMAEAEARGIGLETFWMGAQNSRRLAVVRENAIGKR